MRRALLAALLVAAGFGVVSCELAVPSTLAAIGCSDSGRVGPPVCPGGQLCVAGQCLACAAKEICGDGIDNNCNGLVDEGCGPGGASAGGSGGTGLGGTGGAAAGTGGAAGAGGTTHPAGGESGSGGASGGASGSGPSGASGSTGAGGTDAGSAGAGGSGGTGGGAGAGGGGSSGKGGGTSGTGGSSAGTSGTGGVSGMTGYNSCVVFESYNNTSSTACATCQKNMCGVDATVTSCFSSRDAVCNPMCCPALGSCDYACYCTCMEKTAECGPKLANAFTCIINSCVSSCM